MSVVEFIADFPDYFLTYSVPNYVLGFFALLVFPVVVLPILIKLDLTDGAFARACAYYFGGLAIVLYGDLPFRAAQAQWLCKTRAGLHVYEAVRVDGFVSIGGLSFVGKGFSFIENDSHLTGWTRTILTQDPPKKMKIDALLGKYKLDFEQGSYFCCAEDRMTARKLDDGHLLGEDVSISITPGWAARFFYSIVPIENSGNVYTCTAPDEEPTLKSKVKFSWMRLVGKAILPKKPSDAGDEP